MDGRAQRVDHVAENVCPTLLLAPNPRPSSTHPMSSFSAPTLLTSPPVRLPFSCHPRFRTHCTFPFSLHWGVSRWPPHECGSNESQPCGVPRHQNQLSGFFLATCHINLVSCQAVRLSLPLESHQSSFLCNTVQVQTGALQNESAQLWRDLRNLITCLFGLHHPNLSIFPQDPRLSLWSLHTEHPCRPCHDFPPCLRRRWQAEPCCSRCPTDHR